MNAFALGLVWLLIGLTSLFGWFIAFKFAAYVVASLLGAW